MTEPVAIERRDDCAHDSMDGTPWVNVWVCLGCDHLVRTFPLGLRPIAPPPRTLKAIEILDLFRDGM